MGSEKGGKTNKDYQAGYRARAAESKDMARLNTYINAKVAEVLGQLASDQKTSKKEIVERSILAFKNSQGGDKQLDIQKSPDKKRGRKADFGVEPKKLEAIAEKYSKVELLRLYLKNKYWAERLQEVNDTLNHEGN